MSGSTPTTAGEKFQQLVNLMARLRAPGGCPWDREQTFDTIKPYLLEETYEVLDRSGGPLVASPPPLVSIPARQPLLRRLTGSACSNAVT